MGRRAALVPGSWYSLRARTLPSWHAAASSPNTTCLPLPRKILLTATGLDDRLSSNLVARFRLEHASTWQAEAIRPQIGAARILIVSRCVHMLSRCDRSLHVCVHV